MKKLLVLFMVLAVVTPVMAADNLSVSGTMRIRTWDEENYDDFSDDGASRGDKGEYFDQRFRMQATLKANDQVKAVTRIDLAEEQWGSQDFGAARYTGDNELQVDRAYLEIVTGPVKIQAGQQYMSVGQNQVMRNNKPGIQLTFNTPLVIELGYSVEQDADWTDASDNVAEADEDNYHLSLLYKTDAFSVEGFYATQITSVATAPDEDTEDTKTVFGVNGKTTIGPVKLNAELALFGGDNGADNATDYMGTQFNVDADMKLSEMVKLGVDLIYSDGTDGDSNENKIAYVGDVFGRLNRSEGGSGNNIFAGDLAPLGIDDVFDPLNRGQGAMGLGVDATITPMAGLDLLVHLLYLSSSEDTAGENGYDTALVYNLGITYALAPKAKLALYYNAVDPELEGDTDADTASNIGTVLQVAF